VTAAPGQLDARVAEVCASRERATLVFDLGAIERTMQEVARAARAARITPLFAMKSFPHQRVRELAARHLAGFDVASLGELGNLTGLPTAPSGSFAGGGPIVSIVDPTGAAIAAAPTLAAHRVIVGCETALHVLAAPPHADIAIRISASITGRDPAIGALLEGSGRRRSRFGLDDRARIGELLALARARGHRVGLHVHHGPVTATAAERFIASARAALALVDVEPAFLDLGGAWHGIADIAAAFTEIRAALGSLEVLVEPGRLYARQAGFATGRVAGARDAGDRLLCVSELSRICHLRWSQVELVASAPRPGAGRKVQIVGATCYEDDVIGEWIVEPAQVAERIVLANVSGYALAWNTSFGGVPPADVVMVE
jgi:diaminopimelate decarboxylase